MARNYGARRGSTANTFALHFIHQFAVNSDVLCTLRPFVWLPAVKRAESSMSAFVARGGHRPLLLPVFGCMAFAFSAITLPTAARATDPVPAAAASEPAVRSGDPVRVNIDQARMLKIPERTATLVVGNPLIADAVVQPGGVVVVTAKSYGATNLVALDRTGTVLMEQTLQVIGPSDPTVVVYRGVERETYSCAPKCERRITIGDSPAYMMGNLQTYGAYNQQALSGQPR